MRINLWAILFEWEEALLEKARDEENNGQCRMRKMQ